MLISSLIANCHNEKRRRERGEAQDPEAASQDQVRKLFSILQFSQNRLCWSLVRYNYSAIINRIIQAQGIKDSMFPIINQASALRVHQNLSSLNQK